MINFLNISEQKSDYRRRKIKNQGKGRIIDKKKAVTIIIKRN